MIFFNLKHSVSMLFLLSSSFLITTSAFPMVEEEPFDPVKGTQRLSEQAASLQNAHSRLLKELEENNKILEETCRLKGIDPNVLPAYKAAQQKINELKAYETTVTNISSITQQLYGGALLNANNIMAPIAPGDENKPYAYFTRIAWKMKQKPDIIELASEDLADRMEESNTNILPVLFNQATQNSQFLTQVSPAVEAEMNKMAFLFAELFNIEIPDKTNANFAKLWKIIERKVDEFPQGK